MAIKKKFLKSKPVCKVTFKLEKKAVNGAKKVALVGDFNDWKENDIKMKKLKDGSFTTTLDLATGKDYNFRYLLDGKIWENDWAADKYAPSGVSGEDNSVVSV
ncbi:MAG: isoamylase early set domain-containing protein [Saprospiraceae bacterium]|nr:isoamylase early set domain-containing protein [Saprospiraceae bacterium]